MAAADTSPFQGIVGNLSSGKSALVHRYLTGTYVQEESPEGELQLLRCSGPSPSPPPPAPKAAPISPFAPLLSQDPTTCSALLTAALSPPGGRFKKEIVVDGQSYLLLIRDEGGPPELQVGGVALPCRGGAHPREPTGGSV